MNNNAKIIIAIAIVAVALGALLLVPALKDPPDAGPDVRTPAMRNIPEPGAGALKLEVETSSSGAEPAPR